MLLPAESFQPVIFTFVLGLVSVKAFGHGVEILGGDSVHTFACDITVSSPDTHSWQAEASTYSCLGLQTDYHTLLTSCLWPRPPPSSPAQEAAAHGCETKPFCPWHLVSLS